MSRLVSKVLLSGLFCVALSLSVGCEKKEPVIDVKTPAGDVSVDKVTEPDGDKRVDVLPLGERLTKRRVLAEVGQHAQLDLRIVRRDEFPPRLTSRKRRAYLATLVGTNRDVLQVGVATTQPARRGDNLIERAVDPTRLGVHELRQRIDVRAAKLRVLAVLDDQLRQRMQRGELFEHRGVGRGAGLRAFDRLEPNLLKQHFGELLRRR